MWMVYRGPLSIVQWTTMMEDLNVCMSYRCSLSTAYNDEKISYQVYNHQ